MKFFASIGILGALFVIAVAVFSDRGDGRGEALPGLVRSPAGGASNSATAASGAPESGGQRTRRAGSIDPPEPRGLATVHVRAVSRGERRPLGPVRITARSWPVRVEETARAVMTSDARGHATLDLPPGESFVLDVSGSEDRAARARVHLPALMAGESREVVIELATGERATYWGRVVRSEDGEPVDGAAARLFGGGPLASTSPLHPPKELLAETSADAGGHFEFELPPSLGLVVELRAPGRSPGWVGVDRNHSSLHDAELLEMRAGAEVEARVLSPAGAPARDATLEIVCELHRLSLPEGAWVLGPARTWTLRAEADGVLRARDLPTEVPLEARVLVSGEVRQVLAEPLVLAPRERRELTIELSEGASLTGRTEDSGGDAVPGLDLWLLPAHRATRHAGGEGYFAIEDGAARPIALRADEDGRFAREGLGAGEWLLGVAPTSRVEASTRIQRVVVPARGGVETVLEVHRDLRVEGLVLDARQRPADHAWVELRAAGCSAPALRARADAAGRFTLGPLSPGQFHVRARSAEGDSVSPSLPIVVPGSEELSLCLVETGSLAGMVVDDAGEATSSRVTVRRRGRTGSEPPGEVDVTWSQRDGTFRFEALSLGSYDVVATTGSGECACARVEVAGAGVETVVVLTLDPGATLRLRHRGDAPDLEAVVVSAGKVVASGRLTPGTTTAVFVPATSCEVRAGGRTYGPFDLARGEERDVLLGGSEEASRD